MTSYPSENCLKCGESVSFSSCTYPNGVMIGHKIDCPDWDKNDDSKTVSREGSA